MLTSRSPLISLRIPARGEICDQALGRRAGRRVELLKPDRDLM